MAQDASATTDIRDQVDQSQHRFVLTTVQPGLLGLADGSISTLAPVFAAAVATSHSLPFLISHYQTAFALALVVVVIELLAIAWVRWRFFPGTRVRNSLIQVTLAGVIVFAVGLIFGGA